MAQTQRRVLRMVAHDLPLHEHGTNGRRNGCCRVRMSLAAVATSDRPIRMSSLLPHEAMAAFACPRRSLSQGGGHIGLHGCHKAIACFNRLSSKVLATMAAFGCLERLLLVAAKLPRGNRFVRMSSLLSHKAMAAFACPRRSLSYRTVAHLDVLEGNSCICFCPRRDIRSGRAGHYPAFLERQLSKNQLPCGINDSGMSTSANGLLLSRNLLGNEDHCGQSIYKGGADLTAG